MKPSLASPVGALTAELLEQDGAHDSGVAGGPGGRRASLSFPLGWGQSPHTKHVCFCSFVVVLSSATSMQMIQGQNNKVSTFSPSPLTSALIQSEWDGNEGACVDCCPCQANVRGMEVPFVPLMSFSQAHLLHGLGGGLQVV